MILFYVFFSEVLSGIYDNNNEKGEINEKHVFYYNTYLHAKAINRNIFFNNDDFEIIRINYY